MKAVDLLAMTKGFDDIVEAINSKKVSIEEVCCQEERYWMNVLF